MLKKMIYLIPFWGIMFSLHAKTCLDSVLAISNLRQGSHQILLLKGADCINCYRAGKIAQEKNILHPDLVIIRDIPKRFANDFIRENLNVNPDSVKILYNDGMWSCINPYIASAVAFVNNGTIEKVVELKSILSVVSAPDLSEDSIDLTEIYGGSESTLIPKGENLIVYNEFKHKIFEYSPSQKKTVFTYKADGHDYLSIDSLGYLLPDVAPWRISYTNDLIRGGEQFLTKNANISSPYLTPNYVYVPLSIIIVDTFWNKASKKRGLTFYPYSYFAKYDYQWNLKQIIAFPYTTFDGYDTFCNSLPYGYYKNDSTFYMMVSSRKSDSLFAIFQTDQSYNYLPKSFLNVQYPKKFPRTSKFGHQITYTALFTGDKAENEYYMFSLDNELYSLHGKKKIKLEGIPDDNMNNDSLAPPSFVLAIKSDSAALYVAYSAPYPIIHVNKYDINTFHLLSSKVVFDGKGAKVFWWGDRICVLKATDDAVTLYRYKYK